MKYIIITFTVLTMSMGNVFGQYQDTTYILSQFTLGGTHSTVHNKIYSAQPHQNIQLYGGFGNEWRMPRFVVQLNFPFEVSSQLANSLEDNVQGDIAPNRKWSLGLQNHYMGKFKKRNHQLGGGINIKLDVNGNDNLRGEYSSYSSLVWALELGPTYAYETRLSGRWLRVQAHLPVMNLISDDTYYVYTDSGYNERDIQEHFQTINRYFSPDLKFECTLFENKAGTNCVFIYNLNFTYLKYDNASPDIRDLSQTAGLKVYFGLDPDMSRVW